MRVVIVGANGFIGAHFAAHLSAAVDDVDLVTNSSRWRLDALGVDRPTMPLADVAWDDADWVFMLAGSGRPQQLAADRISAIGDEWSLHKAVLTHIANSGRSPSIVVSSSRTVYGRPESLPVAESAALRPSTGYASEKLFIEQLYAYAARDLALSSLRLRITNPFGPLEWAPGRGHGLLSQFAKQAVESGQVNVFGDGLQLRDYVHVTDVAELLDRLALGQPLTGSRAMNVGSGVGTSIADLAATVAAQANAKVVHVAAPPGAAAIESGDFVANIDFARSLDWSPMMSSPTDMATVAAAEILRLTTGKPR